MRGITRFGVVSFMVGVLLATGKAQAGVCVSVRGNAKVGSDCRSVSTSLTIGVTTTGGPIGYLKLDDAQGKSARVTVGNETGLLGIALDPGF